MKSVLERALDLVNEGVFRVDPDAGLVFQTFVTPLYSYERPVGALALNGYVRVYLPGNRGRDSVYAHRLIWSSAHGTPRPPLDEINHRNGVKHDNRLSNLEAIDGAGNKRHAVALGLIKVGDAHPLVRLREADIATARRLLADGWTNAAIAAELGVSASLISHVRTGYGRFALPT